MMTWVQYWVEMFARVLTFFMTQIISPNGLKGFQGCTLLITNSKDVSNLQAN